MKVYAHWRTNLHVYWSLVFDFENSDSVKARPGNVKTVLRWPEYISIYIYIYKGNLLVLFPSMCLCSLKNHFNSGVVLLVSLASKMNKWPLREQEAILLQTFCDEQLKQELCWNLGLSAVVELKWYVACTVACQCGQDLLKHDITLSPKTKARTSSVVKPRAWSLMTNTLSCDVIYHLAVEDRSELWFILN